MSQTSSWSAWVVWWETMYQWQQSRAQSLRKIVRPISKHEDHESSRKCCIINETWTFWLKLFPGHVNFMSTLIILLVGWGQCLLADTWAAPQSYRFLRVTRFGCSVPLRKTNWTIGIYSLRVKFSSLVFKSDSKPCNERKCISTWWWQTLS